MAIGLRVVLLILVTTTWLVGPRAHGSSSEFLSVESRLILSWTQSWGELGLNEAAHERGVKAAPLIVGDKTFAKGLGTHANSEILVILGGAYAEFDAQVGALNAQGGSVIFKVLVDEQVRFESGVLRGGEPAQPVHVPVGGGMLMRLVVSDAGDGYVADSAVWGDARLTAGAGAGPDGNAAISLGTAVDVASCARVITADPTRMDGAHNLRTESFPIGELYVERELLPDAGGLYAVPRSERVGCIGLEWIERRRLNRVALEFADPATMPAAKDAQLQYWVIKLPMDGTPAVSRWQGRWEPLRGEIRAEGNRWVAEIDWKDNPEMSKGTLKVRWILPPADADASVRKLQAWTLSRWDEAGVRLELERPRPGQSGEVEIYSGEIINGEAAVARQTWDLAQPLALNVRYSKPMPWMTDRTILRIKLPDSAFGVAIDDVLSSGCVYVESAGFFAAAEPVKTTLAEYKASHAGDKTVLEQVREMPDQTFAQANATVHRAEGDLGPTALSLACEQHKFIVGRDGSIEWNNDIASMSMGMYFDWKKVACQMLPEFGAGAEKQVTRVLENDWMPIPVTTTRVGGVDYRQRTFVAPYDETPLPQGAPAWLNHKPLCLSEFTIENTTSATAQVALKLSFVTHMEPAAPAQVETRGDRTIALKNGEPMAVLVADPSLPESLAIERRDNHWILIGTLPAGARAGCVVQIPAWNATAEELPDFARTAALHEKTQAYWTRLMEPAMKIELPEPLLRNAIIASQVHGMLAARNESGERIAPWCASMFYGPLESEAHSIIRGMQFMGHDDFARRSLDFFIGRYDPEGFLTTGYTVMGTGWHLWTLGEYYALSRDDAWMKRVAPKVSWACQWVMSQREKTKRLDVRGERVREFGLMPPGVMADWAAYQYYFYLNGYYYAGLKAAAEALAAIGDPQADAMLASAAEHREAIMQAYHLTQAQAPVFALRDGSWVPEYPTHAYCPSPIQNFYAGDDVGRSWCYDVELGSHHLVPMGVMDPQSADARTMMDHMEDVQFLSEGWFYYPAAQSRADWFNLGGFAKVQPYYARTTEVYALQDEVKPFIRSYFNALISLLNREDLSLWEHFMNGAFNKTHETGYFLYQSRTMLLTERGDELWLAPFVTNQWMKDGMTVGVSNAPTRFGRTGYRITSHVDQGYIEATIEPPARQRPGAIVLRLRHPDGKAMRRVLADGKPITTFDNANETIRLEPTASTMTVRAEY